MGTVRLRVGQHVRFHAAQRHHRQCISAHVSRKFSPAKTRRFGVRWRWKDWAQQRVVEPKLTGTGNFSSAMAGGTDPREGWALAAGSQAG